jgi:hypothetical protein
VLFELTLIQKETLLAKQVDTNPIAEEMLQIASKYKNPDIEGLASYIQGDTYYVQSSKDDTSKLVRAVPLLLQAQSLVKMPEYRFYILRTLAVMFGQLHDAEQLKKVYGSAEKLIKSVLDTQSDLEQNRIPIFDKICHLQEGLALGQGYALQPSAFTSVERLSGFLTISHNANAPLPFRAIQMIRTQLEIERRLGDKQTLQKVGDEGLNLAKILIYPRYEQRIRELLNDSLN